MKSIWRFTMSTKEQQVQEMTNKIANFISYMAKVLPDDVQEKIHELAQDEKNPMAKSIYETMQHNMDLAAQLNRPSCQDTGVLQFWVKVGSNYPLLGELEDILREATYKATQEAPLRLNCVETFDEFNTGKNIGLTAPYIHWDIIPGRDDVEIFPYMAGGGCSLPGSGKTLMPGEGYEGVAKFVLDLMTSYGLNACPPLLVGVGIATTIDTAAGLSKKALMRPVSSKAPNEKAAYMEQLLDLKPDVVLGLVNQHKKYESQLQSNNIPAVLFNYDGIKDNVPMLTFLGELTNHQDKAKSVIATYESNIQKVKDAIKNQQPARIAVLRATGKGVTAETDEAVTASMVKELGMTNVVTSHLDGTTKDKTVPYSLETLTADNPDIIFVVTMGKEEEITKAMKQAMTDNPAWANLKAVQNNRVIYLPSKLFLLNPGLQTPEAMARLVKEAYGIDVTF